MERTGAEVARLEGLFDEHDIRGVQSRAVTEADGATADAGTIDDDTRTGRHAAGVIATAASVWNASSARRSPRWRGTPASRPPSWPA